MGAADMEIVELSPDHLDAVAGFLAELPDRDGTFLKDDLADPDLLRSWLRGAAGRRWVAVDGGTVVGLLALLPLRGRSDHVGEVRLVVRPDRRGTGLGRELGRRALISAVEMGLSKVVVEVLADQEVALGLFTALGFTGEALLRDQIRADDGDLRDLVVLAHHVDDVRARMDTLGLTDELRS